MIPQIDRRRKRNLIIISSVIVFLVILTALEIGIRGPQYAIPIADNILVFALFNFNIVLLLLLTVLLFRNLVKLYFERRQKILGAKFKSKLIVAFLTLTLVPSILLFIVAMNMINNSIESWFNIRIERSLEESLEVAQVFYQNSEKNAILHGQYISRVITQNKLFSEDRRETLIDFLMDQQEQYSLATIGIFSAQGQELVHVKDPVLPPFVSTSQVNLDIVKESLSGKEISSTKGLSSGDLVQGFVPIFTDWTDKKVAGVVVVAYHIPQNLEFKMRGITKAFQEYKQLKLLKLPIKGSYIMIFLMVTLIILFSATWFGLYLARGITVPIQKLAEGTEEIAKGNYNFKVKVKADDEIGILVDSFNKMTDDIAEKSTEISERKKYTETVLENIATGVVSIDSDGRITTINKAASKMLRIDSGEIVGKYSSEIFSSDELKEISSIVRRMEKIRDGNFEKELKLRIDRMNITLLTSVTALKSGDSYLGMVIVFDDLTELIKAQRLAAWREVAQRIAHEIKNPLTPIQLSAQRLRKKYNDGSTNFNEVFQECTTTIIDEVEGLKRLVDEFSKFARMPSLSLKSTDLQKVLESTISIYADLQPGIKIKTDFMKNFPLIMADSDQMKRVLINLIDNAIDAIKDSGEILIKTSLDDIRGKVIISVSDNGVGISPEDKEKLFLPYFSTKKGGTGLGLSIVNQIVLEHHGTISVQDNIPRGSTFVIELPLNTATKDKEG